MSKWGAVCAHNGAFETAVTTPDGVTQFSTTGAKRWSGTVGEAFRMVSAGGHLFVCAQVGDRKDYAGVLRDDGLEYSTGSPATGTACVALRVVTGALELVWITHSGRTLARQRLSIGLVPLEEVRFSPVPFAERTSEGILGFNDDGSVVYTEVSKPIAIGPATGYLWTADGDWKAFQENGVPDRVSIHNVATRETFLVFSGHTVAPPGLAVIGDAVVVVPGGHDLFIPRSQWLPWVPPHTAPVPVPPTDPVPPASPESPMPDIPRSPISHAEVESVVAQCKAEVEAAGIVYWTDAQVAQFYAENGKDATFPKAQQEKALMATSRAAVRLAQRYPSAQIGLERYSGPSSVAGVSYDIILLGRSGPSSDVMAGGVRPVSQIPPDHEVTPEMVAAWRSDWVAPFIYRPDLTPVQEPVPTPTPLPEPAPLPTPGNTDAVLAFLRDLDAKVDALAAVVGATADAVTAVRDGLNVMDLNVETLLMDVDQIRNQEYETRIFGSAVTLRPKR